MEPPNIVDKTVLLGRCADAIVVSYAIYSVVRSLYSAVVQGIAVGGFAQGG